jgi:phosphomannomutase
VENVVTWLIVVLCVLFVFKELQPSVLFKNTTPTGGDMGAHVWLPAFIKRVFIPHMRLTGWTPDWYSGFPALTYYFPLPMYLIAFASYIIPYNIAFKLVTVLGLLTLPVAAWAMGRLARARFPIPAALAVGAVAFLFSREFTIYGGNIASTMAGEFGFSLSLSLALLFLGLVARGLQDGTHRATASIVLACTGLCHILPLFFALGGLVVLLAMSLIATRDPARLKWSLPVVCTGGAVIAFWALPFYFDLPYATNMGYGKLHDYAHQLFPAHDTWLMIFAFVGVLLSVWRRSAIGVFLGLMAALSALVFVITPAARLWNARVLPFWFLCLYLLAGVAVAEVCALITEMIRTDREWVRGGYIATAVVTLLAGMIWVNYPLRQLPFGHTTKTGEYDWFGITSADSSFIPAWVYWNYSGYQNVNKTRQKEYFALVDEMKKIGADPQHGCGQAMWEYEPELNDMGTPDALMLLPYWTNGCIGSEEGLYYESSATTPYHFLNAAELSDSPSNPVRGLSYPSGPNVQEGIQHLQMLGDKYFLADTPDVQAAANKDSSLLLVATVGPFPVTYTEGTSTVRNVTWNIYEILDSDLVQPLVNQPVVLKGVQSRNPQVWLNASQAWYLNPSDWGVMETASGPKEWTRVNPNQTNLPETPLPAIQVSNLKQSPESISFDVDQTGVPVVVKQSYFPNWHVSGAKGPYRVTPNQMVVIPTAQHVTLSYGKTAIDWMGDVLTLLGIAALFVMWRLGRVVYRKSSGDPQDALVFWAARPGKQDKVPLRMAPPDQAVLDTIFKAYDIRGTVPDQLNADLARRVGAAFARFCGSDRVLVARDMRPSGVELVDAFSEGVISLGVDVVDLGMTSTDEMYFASGSLDAPGAIFTASHNPPQYNGIKLCRAGARPIGADTGLKELKGAVASGIIPALEPGLFGTITYAGVLYQYAEKVRSFVDLAALRPLRVIADTANGMGGLVVPAVFSALPFDLEVMYGELDGTFPNHPADPIQPANLEDLRLRIVETGADVGLAFDGDADRCFLVDDRGEPLSGSTTTALVASAMLDKRPGATILYNLICSKAVPEIIRERGGTAVRTRVGHSYIKAVMADTDALFGGEHSGHYYFRDNYRADSGTIAALVVLEVLSKTGRPLSEIRKQYERYASSGEINTEVLNPEAVIDAVASHYSGPEYEGVTKDHLDGLTVDFGDWWFNLRPSNTEPLLRLNLEAEDPDSCRVHTEEVLALISAGPPSRNGSEAEGSPRSSEYGA